VLQSPTTLLSVTPAPRMTNNFESALNQLPAPGLHRQIRIELETLSTALRLQGRLLPLDALLACYATFAERFGPAVLRTLSGERLLRAMFDGSRRDSLVYWLERGDKSYPASTFGLINGGPPLAMFGLYRRSGVDVWVTGRSNKDRREVSLTEAIAIATSLRDELMEAWEVLSRFDGSLDDSAYLHLQQSMAQVAPVLSNRAWAHKYFHMLRPDVLDDFHIEELQSAHLISLLEVPPEGSGRYFRAGRYVRIAKELGWPINHLAAVLNNRPETSRHGHWLIPSASVSRRDGAVTLSASVGIPSGSAFVVQDGQEIVAIGRLSTGYDPDAPTAADEVPVRWIDDSRWRLVEPEGASTRVRRLKSARNRVEIERRMLAHRVGPAASESR
jgi:hypothetical protein